MDIFREPTEEEKSDFKPLVKKEDSLDRYTKQVNQMETEYFKSGKPFCKKCAIADFKEVIEFKLKRMNEAERFETDLEQFNMDIPNPEKYGDLERFKSMGIRETLNPANAAKGIKASMHKSSEFQCKVRGCKISIFGEQEIEK